MPSEFENKVLAANAAIGTAMKLVRVLDLVAKPIAGKMIDYRSRNADGSLMYEGQYRPDDFLYRRKAVGVIIRKEKKEKWLNLHWTPDHTKDNYDCGFSGWLMEGGRYPNTGEYEKNYVLIETE